MLTVADHATDLYARAYRAAALTADPGALSLRDRDACRHYARAIRMGCSVPTVVEGLHARVAEAMPDAWRRCSVCLAWGDGTHVCAGVS